MRKYLYVGLGGAVGAVFRYIINALPLNRLTDFISNILIINVTGSFMLAFFFILATKLFHLHEDITLGVGTGLLGGYTTFSTFCKESILFILNKDYLFAAFYIFISVIVSLFASYLGYIFAHFIIKQQSRAIGRRS